MPQKSKKDVIIRRWWKPRDGERYWYVYSHGKVKPHIYKPDSIYGREIEKERIRIGNCFMTQREAKYIARKFKEILRNA